MSQQGQVRDPDAWMQGQANTLPPVPELPPYSVWRAQSEHMKRVGRGFVGAGKELANLTYQTLRLPVAAEAKALTAIDPEGKEGPWESIPWIAPTPEILKPKGEAEELGQFGMRAVEFLAPQAWAAKLPLLVRLVSTAAAGGGLSFLHGAKPEEVALASALSATPATTEGVASIVNRVPEPIVRAFVRKLADALPIVGGGWLGYRSGGWKEAAVGAALTGLLGDKLKLSKVGEAAVRAGASAIPTVTKVAAPVGAAATTPAGAPEPPPGIPENAPAQFVPSGLPTRGKVVIRRPGQKPEIMDAYVDADGRVKLAR